MDYATAIRQQAEDLQEELKELNFWQEEILSQEATNAKRRVCSTNTGAIPPIRGTVPSLKEAVLKTSGKESKEDPVKNMKEKGNVFFQAGKIEEAIDAYSAGIDLDAEGPVAHVLYGNRALCYLKLERWGDAERDASSCLFLNRSYSKGYFRRAMARKRLGNLRGARTDLEAVLALVPNDPSATSEMVVITQMMQLEREKAGPVIKKKVVIAEVDDDEQEDEDTNEIKTKTCENKVNNDTNANDVREKEHLRKEMQELELAREAQRKLQESRAKEAETNLSRKLRTSARVEIIEGVEPVLPKGNSSTPMAESQETLTMRGRASSASTTAVPKSGETDRKTQHIVPRVLKTSSRWSKETLRAPKSFTEFERVFAEITDNEEFCCHYISLISPATLQTLFGNNMTPEILLGLLRTVRLLPGNVAIAFLRGLCAVKRVDDLSLFFDGSEKKLVEEVLDVILSCGASQDDMCFFRERLRMT